MAILAVDAAATAAAVATVAAACRAAHTTDSDPDGEGYKLKDTDEAAPAGIH